MNLERTRPLTPEPDPDPLSPLEAEVLDVADELRDLASALEVARWWDAVRQLRDLAERLEEAVP